MSRTIPTWAGRSEFSYSGSVATGTVITFGARGSATVTARSYRILLSKFGGRTVDAGTSRTNPPRGSLGAWLITNVSPVALASYVAAILVHEGYARKVGATIAFEAGANA